MRASFVAPVVCSASSQNSRKNVSTTRPVTSLSVGDFFIGLVTEVGGANSAWIDFGATTITGKPVKGRLKLGKKAPPKIGSMLPVIVHRLDAPAARVEVKRTFTSTELPLTLQLEDLAVGQKVKGLIVGFTKAGAVVDVGTSRATRDGGRMRCMGLMRRPYFEPTWASPLDLIRKDSQSRVLSVGDDLDLFVRIPKPASAQLFLSALEVTPESLAEDKIRKVSTGRRKKRRRPVSDLVVGSKRSGIVRNAMIYGVFIDVGVKKDGLLHYSEMGPFRRGWRDILLGGTKVEVLVKKVDGERVNLELVSVEGYEDDENESVNLALERPNKKSTEVVRETEEIRNAEDPDSNSDADEEIDEGGEEDSFKKFNDDYFEDKYKY